MQKKKYTEMPKLCFTVENFWFQMWNFDQSKFNKVIEMEWGFGWVVFPDVRTVTFIVLQVPKIIIFNTMNYCYLLIKCAVKPHTCDI